MVEMFMESEAEVELKGETVEIQWERIPLGTHAEVSKSSRERGKRTLRRDSV